MPQKALPKVMWIVSARFGMAMMSESRAGFSIDNDLRSLLSCATTENGLTIGAA
jgi:hypothetical protein